MSGLSGVLLSGISGWHAENQIRGPLSLTGCDEHQTRVFLQRIQPVRQICRAVVDGSILDATVPRKKCGAHFGNEFLTAVVVVSEAFEVCQTRTIQSDRMSKIASRVMAVGRKHSAFRGF
jgi:hypothetical protein